jgi:hypothetical protein
VTGALSSERVLVRAKKAQQNKSIERNLIQCDRVLVSIAECYGNRPMHVLVNGVRLLFDVGGVKQVRTGALWGKADSASPPRRAALIAEGTKRESKKPAPFGAGF